MPKKKKQYLVAITRYNTRDTQVAIHNDADHADDDAWKDFENEVVVSTFETYTEGEAIQKAAIYAGVSEDVLVAYPLRGETK
jgi:hypothetical protein